MNSDDEIVTLNIKKEENISVVSVTPNKRNSGINELNVNDFSKDFNSDFNNNFNNDFNKDFNNDFNKDFFNVNLNINNLTSDLKKDDLNINNKEKPDLSKTEPDSDKNILDKLKNNRDSRKKSSIKKTTIENSSLGKKINSDKNTAKPNKSSNKTTIENSSLGKKINTDKNTAKPSKSPNKAINNENKTSRKASKNENEPKRKKVSQPNKNGKLKVIIQDGSNIKELLFKETDTLQSLYNDFCGGSEKKLQYKNVFVSKFSTFKGIGYDEGVIYVIDPQEKYKLNISIVVNYDIDKNIKISILKSEKIQNLINKVNEKTGLKFNVLSFNGDVLDNNVDIKDKISDGDVVDVFKYK
ncbi:hypothetical protein DMUE_1319 [Dictyocoela muelleri]|nr:hypothetical protein DMUE_1319 [Dictyocoela muelleri]